MSLSSKEPAHLQVTIYRFTIYLTGLCTAVASISCFWSRMFHDRAQRPPGNLARRIHMSAGHGAVDPHRHKIAGTRETGAFVSAIDRHLRMTAETDSVVVNDVPTVVSAPPCGLSIRAMNVFKLLAAEITGECPPRERWTPSNALLRQVTVQRLLATRNRGPKTISEIIRWADSRGVAIQPLFHAGKSLSETWRDLNMKFTTGELTKAEVAEALEKSVRRRSSRIPIAVQKILLKLLNTVSEQSCV